MRNALPRSYIILGVALAAFLVACDRPQETPQESEIKQPLPKCREATVGGPEEVVRVLYRAYPPADPKKFLLNEPKKVLLKYFDEKPAGLLVQIRQCMKRTRDDCGPGYDLMYDSNTVEISDFQICAMDPGTNTVPVQFRDADRPKFVKYKLTYTGAGWRIADILYSRKPDDPYGGSMIKLLAALLSDEASN
jgi:hypothetical protein